MKLKSLRARGFKGFKHGLGMDEIELDLSSLTGLVAICGQNGRGKTTLLELLHPFRQLASRAGSMQQHVSLRDSFKELAFEFAGHEYRTMVKLDAQSEKAEGFIWQDGEPLVGGKVRDYDKKINELFGSPELFFSSVFAAQNARKLSDMTTGEIKGLFSEFLRLDLLEEYEQTAKQAGTIQGSTAGRIERDIEAMRERAGNIETLETAWHEANNGISAAMHELDRHRSAITAAEQAHEAASAAVQKNAVIREKSDGLKREKAATEKTNADFTNQVKRDLDDLRTICTAAMAELERSEKLSSDPADFEGLDAEKATLQAAAVCAAVEIDAADEKAKKAGAESVRLNIKFSNLMNERDKIKRNPKIASLTAEICAAKKAAAVLDKRSPECTDPHCPLIAAAVEAAERLPLLEEQLADLQAEIEKQAADMAAVIDQLSESRADYDQDEEDAEAEKKALQGKQRTVAARITAIDAILSRRADVAAARERKAAIAERVAELKNTGIAKKAELEKRSADHYENITRLDEAINAAEAELIKNAEMKEAEQKEYIKYFGKQATETERTLTRLQAEREELTRKLDQANADAKKIETMKADAQAVRAEVSEWQYLQNACGKNGLRALEIDGVAPAICQYANDLLRATYGPTFSVRIVTQDVETGKEVFNIVVIKDDGEECLIENLSGGQRVWILKALRLAMTLISKEKSALNFSTAFGDEEDGALDSDNAQLFVDMYRQFMKSGGFESFFFISHRPECVAMADNRIKFSENGIEVN